MKKFEIFTDSCIDLPAELAAQLKLKIIPLSITVEKETYYNYLDEREISNKDFYQLLREHKLSQTSQATPQDFLEAMEPILKAGTDILSISLSSVLSGTYQSSLIAKEELLNKYPERKIITIDSLCASMGQGLLLTYAAQMRNRGSSLEETAAWVENNKKQICHLFTVGDLNHLKRGGRLSYAKAFLGTILRIKPLLHVNNEGKLIQTGAVRGRRRVLERLVNRMENTITDAKEQLIYISHGDCEDEALELKRKIKERMAVKDVLINFIGPVIGSHSGIDTLAIFYLGNDRTVPYK